jgi:hypothetical protein
MNALMLFAWLIPAPDQVDIGERPSPPEELRL